MHDTPRTLPKLSVSVIIPAYNEEAFIKECISSVLRTGWPREQLEILVIDHQSTDATADFSRSAGARVLDQTRDKKIGAVRNAGLTAATGEFVAFVDADCTVPCTWLASAIDLLQSDDKIGAVGGPCLSPRNGTWVEKCMAPTEVTQGAYGNAISLATSSLIARAKLLRELGAFDESVVSGEDDDISNKIRQRGLSLISASNCHIVHHGYPRTLFAVLKKEIWHGSNHIDVRSEFDPVLFLAFFFSLTSVAVLISLFLTLFTRSEAALTALFGSLAAQVVPPFLYALRRIRQSPTEWHLLFPTLIVGYSFFLGHGIGVITNFFRRRPVTAL